MKQIYLCLILMFITSAVFAQTSLEGKLKDKETGEPILFGTVALYKNGILITGAESDVDGNFYVSDVEPGTYDVEVKYLGYSDMMTTGVFLKAGQTTRLNFDMIVSGVILEEAIITAYRNPLVNVDNTTTGTVISSEKIGALPVKGLNSIVATSAGVATQDGSDPSIRGSRSNETVYIIDGIRTFGSVPQSEIDQLQIITGGIEAKYGDVTGGIISLTTKGPSDKFSAGFDIETSKYLDPYGYNLGMGYLSGPILKNKKGQTTLGYRVSGQFRDIKDNSPSAVGVYRAPESIIRQLEENPLYQLGNVNLPAAELLRNADIGDPLKARPNTGDRDINLVAKLDARLSNAIDLSLSGNYIKNKNQFTPNIAGWTMLNWTNNPFQLSDRYRVNFRFRHKLGAQSSSTKEQGAKKSSLQNFSYTLQGGYERGRDNSEDIRHQDRLFDYGYYGATNVDYNPFFGFDIDTDQGTIDFRHLGYTQVEGEFVPGTQNSTLAFLNRQNGLIDNDLNNVWNNLFANPGQVYNTYNKSESDLVTFNVSSGFDFLPGGSEKGRHNIQLGFMYEQRVNRNYTLNPRGLWRLGDLLVNNHIKGIDPEVVLRDTMVFNPLVQANVSLPIYQTLVQTSSEDKFYRTIREKLGVGINEFVNIDGISPDQLSLDMFSAKELSDQQLIDYYGYDYLGNKLSGTATFADFFRERNADGTRTFNVAPFTPIYMAGYIQDKFSYKDIIFRLGVRVDYYDANTKVLKDPYSLYEIESADQFYQRTGRTQPASIGDDYKVYVTGEESDEVIGYRVGDQWFSSNGTSVTNGNAIFNGGIVYPAYVGRTASGQTPARVLNIQDPDFDINTSFDDYKPQFNVMPRLAFSFPISEEAGFFAHYDVLYQRPQSNVIMTALDYFYFENIGASGTAANNPALRPVRTIDYEVGFQQKISEDASMKISGYQKEMKDLIQRRAFANIPSPINNYQSYGNLDFGNVTGFTFQFDRRRTKNLELNLTYTLQFANGSGSDANSSRNINTRGPIRNLVPLSFDERHRVTAVVDYRYASGKNYDGPVIGGLKIFENAGITFTTLAVSGRPYTRNQIPSQYGGSGFVGELNGSRLPWTFNVDLRADKRITIKPSKDARPLNANIYFRVQNLLNTKNVKGVYGATGSPDNDGYLLSELGQDRVDDVINTNRGIDAFLDAYSWGLLSPGNFFFPRRMYLGLTFDF
ncbi:MAG TPA: TonB-dependent receptor [Saprospiraceae bacterium]|nr:TonB-dependent receptor [Saprospiraceae bacterium]